MTIFFRTNGTSGAAGSKSSNDRSDGGRAARAIPAEDATTGEPAAPRVEDETPGSPGPMSASEQDRLPEPEHETGAETWTESDEQDSDLDEDPVPTFLIQHPTGIDEVDDDEASAASRVPATNDVPRLDRIWSAPARRALDDLLADIGDRPEMDPAPAPAPPPIAKRGPTTKTSTFLVSGLLLALSAVVLGYGYRDADLTFVGTAADRAESWLTSAAGPSATEIGAPAAAQREATATVDAQVTLGRAQDARGGAYFTEEQVRLELEPVRRVVPLQADRVTAALPVRVASVAAVPPPGTGLDTNSLVAHEDIRLAPSRAPERRQIMRPATPVAPVAETVSRQRSAPMPAPVQAPVQASDPAPDVSLKRATEIAPERGADTGPEIATVSPVRPAAEVAPAEPASSTALAALQRGPRQDGPDVAEGESSGGLISRAEEILKGGDVISARLLFELAAREGSAEAAYGTARTYDPICFAKLGVHGPTPDAAEALRWYRIAADSGHAGAMDDLLTLENWLAKPKTERLAGG